MIFEKKKNNSIIKIVVYLLFFVFIYSGCSQNKLHKTLSIFFDGVPYKSKDSTVIKKDSIVIKDSLRNLKNTKKQNSIIVSVHPPYRDRECSNCHDNNDKTKFTKPLQSLCFNCHDDFSKKYKFVHGPVASGSCIACHNPHQSKLKKLVLRENQSLCTYCHDKKQVLKNEVHSDIGETNCTECHNPHGGDDKNILK